MNRILRNRLLATTICVGAVMAASPSYAQAVPGNAPANSGPIEGQAPEVAAPAASDPSATAPGDIVVTGSRIPTPNLSSASPVTVLNSAEIKLTGVTRVEDLINQLPQAFGDQGGNVSNGSTGTSTVNLRNLGANRTLVLINGRRLVPGDVTDSAADINFIPAALIKRVDVLTGGASSTYGADAVGGVVNFIMDDNFSGFRVDGQYSLLQHDNNSNAKGLRDALNRQNFGFPDGNSASGGTVDVTATIGGGFDDNKGHITAYVGYRKINALLQSKRDYSSCGLTTAGAPAGSVACGGSFSSNNFVTSAEGGGSTTYQLGQGRTFTPGSNVYNFGPTNYYQRPDERYTAGFFAHYDVSDAFKPYLEGMFMDDRSVAQIAPSGDFGNTLSINCDNPLLSAQQSAIVCAPGNLLDSTGTSINGGGTTAANFIDPTTGRTYNRGALQVYRRNVEGGPRQDDLQHTSYRIVAGAKGNVAKGISYDAYYQYGRTNFQETYRNDVSISRLTKSLDVVNVGGTPTCRSVVDGSDPNCVPYDIFTAGGVSQAAVNYLGTPGFQRGSTSEQVVSASATALLGEYGIKSPFADEGVAINAGYEYRKESLQLATDLEFSTGDLSGQGAPTLPVAGSFSVNEGYTEVRLPVVHDRFIYDLSFSGGYRYSDYKIGNRKTSTNTYKFEGTFAPIRDITFRAAYNRSVRAPNIQELFAPSRVALNGSNDPCAGAIGANGTVNGNTAAQCALTGVTAAQFGNISENPAAQYNGLIGGNANLTPEKADTYTVGVVLQPSFIPRLAITVDAFQIKVDKTITTIGQDTTLTTCIATADPTFCGLINRDQFGSLWRTPNGYVVDTNQNLGSIKTRGIDVGASYSHEIGSIGSLGLSMNGTYLDQFKTDNGVSAPYDCSGYYGLQCGTPAPKWRHRARATFTTTDGVGLSVQWRYFDPVKLDRTSGNPTLAGPSALVNQRIPAQSYFDLTATVAIADNYTFRLGVNNILDRDPPLVTSQALSPVFGNGNTYPNVYDALGRYIFAGVTLNF
ncbi:TonB-dependent receptor domain-containing protein [Sphingomonas sp. NFX23]|uniref:TonB-dependent receptor domain-containing protein n=1 Tax=Sphingomonas sp. NFX23 TaxID=2819532 RepID=UPI003CF0704C